MGHSYRNLFKTSLVLILAMLIALLPFEVQTASNAVPRGCEKCHNNFKPFEVVARTLTFEPGQEVVLECLVYNNGQHSIKGLSAELIGFATGTRTTVDEEEFSGSVSRASSSTHRFTVEDGATGLIVQMSEDPGILGLGDARLTITAPNGDSFSTSSGGSEEELILDSNDTKSAGSGEFVISVDLVSGLRPVAYTMNVLIEYRDPERVKSLDDLGPGEETIVVWNLTLTEEEVRELQVSVTGIVYHAHDDGDKEEEYTVVRPFKVGSSAGARAGTFEIKPYRNGLGYFLIGLMLASLITGLPWSRKQIPSLSTRTVLNVHCLISWGMVITIAAHAYLASLTHPYTSLAVITGETMTVVFLILTLIPTFDLMRSGFRQDIVGKIGRTQYKWVNRAAIIMTLVVLCIHIYA